MICGALTSLPRKISVSLRQAIQRSPTLPQELIHVGKITGFEVISRVIEPLPVDVAIFLDALVHATPSSGERFVSNLFHDRECYG